MADQPYSKPYSFTVTVFPTGYAEPPETQYDRLVYHLMELLESITPSENITVVAETTKNYNIHFHGTIRFPLERKVNGDFRNPVGKFYDTFRGPTMRKTKTKKEKVFGFVMIKEIDNEIRWNDYLQKGFKEFKADIERKPIIHDGLSLFDTMTWLDYGRHGGEHYH